MRVVISVGIGMAVVLTSFAAAAAKTPAKAPPACSAITFRPLPAGMPDGEQQAGMYKSRQARLELRAEVKQGQPRRILRYDRWQTGCRCVRQSA